ncbi:hypothetical protein PoB_002403200 [Plakobranchus ocellatus]|uniref:Uncharacterized protein n=1 Tax=Plakobranchus ocellatus TaxID=259542 RepID=A0AAV3ZS97_9GAST|nr:hypothetical protein PoB_002403200 [Plakobranchus ocellatus]
MVIVVVVGVIVLVMLKEMVGMVVVMVMVMAMSGVAVMLVKVVVAIVLQMVVVVVMVVVMSCVHESKNDWLRNRSCSTIAKPGLERTCLGFAGDFCVVSSSPATGPLDGQRDSNNWIQQQKDNLIMVPAVGGTVNKKSASDLKGVFCHKFELHHRCSGLIEGLHTSDHLDEEHANQARISLSAS